MAGGRPTLLNDNVSNTILAAVRAGNYIETAAALAGIARSTLYKWLRDGSRAQSGPLREFSDAVKKALAQAESEDLQIVGTAAQTVWQAACWRLERRWPDRWGRDRVEIAELRKKLAQLEKILCGETGEATAKS